MKALVRFTLAQRVLFNLLFIVLMLVGAFALLRTPVERYPNIEFGKAYITTYFPGASPREVEALITGKIEDAIETMDNLEYVRSTSYRERSSILVKFYDDTDYQASYDEMRLKVQSIIGDLPVEADPPRFTYIDVSVWQPTFSINLFGDRDNHALTLMAEELKAALRQVSGINEVRLQGEYPREFHLDLAPDTLSRYGITFDQVSEALKQANVIIPAGDYTTDGGEFIIQVDERFRDRDQVLNTIVRRDGDGSMVRIADLTSQAELSHRDPFVITSVNGQDCITLLVIKTPSANALTIVKNAREIIEHYQPIFAKEGVRLITTQDSTVRIKDSIRVLGSNLLLGVILVSLLIWYFMGFRNAALTTIGIPFSFLVTMIILYLTGNSVNEISLFAFVLVSGVIVDDAIVVVENIFRHSRMGKGITDSVVDGTAEVFLPVVSATLTTCAAFLPMLIMTGSIGDFFAIIPKAISFALLASLFECLLILPIHYLDFGPRATETSPDEMTEDNSNENLLMTAFRKIFDVLLHLALRYRLTTLGLLMIAFVAAMTIALLSISGKSNLIRIEFFPDDYSLYYAEITGPVGTPIEETSETLRKLSKEIMAEGEGMAESAVASAGYYINDDYQPVWGNHLGHVAVTLPARKARHFEDFPKNDVVAHLDLVRTRLTDLLAETGFTLRVRAEKDGPPEGKDVNIRILGANLQAVEQLASAVHSYLRNQEVLAHDLLDLDTNQGQPGRIFRLKLRDDRVAEYGIPPAQVAALAASILNGRTVGKFRLADEEVDLKVRIAPESMGRLEDTLGIIIRDHPNGPIRLGDLCEVENSLEPGYLNRFQGQRAVTLTANIKNGSDLSASAVVRMVKGHYETIRDRYPGATLNFSGEFASTHDSFVSLTYAFSIAILLIYLILATQFQSYIQPFAILSAVIFSLIGIIFGTMFSRSLFTVNSFIAVVGVTGVVVNDSLVLIEFINKRYRTGLSRREAILTATHIRLRPIILTTLTTTLGLLPMALGFPEYSLVWGTMAMTFVTGLCTATFLTIFVVPVQWDLIEGAKEWWRGRKKVPKV
ncbi:MAG: efflux RND transporter permease subunit [Proteobacteria bacterium]|nr:efflux RND transporter permease subunit [Pseudomonadota bacterium]MBU1686947.1 efflux RND transporter permease subunit [Pseudomonadota bacterium]